MKRIGLIVLVAVAAVFGGGCGQGGNSLCDRAVPEANLRQADLSGCDLSFKVLTKADFSGANLSDANLQNANLQNANLQDAVLGGAILKLANLQGANLRGADLTSADLTGADLTGADIEGANLSGAVLNETVLVGLLGVPGKYDPIYKIPTEVGKKPTQEVKDNIAALVRAIEAYATEMGDYPPSSLAAYGIRGNGVNDGIECLLACLQTRKHNGPFLGDLDPLQRSNVDSDILSKLQSDQVRKRIDWSRLNDILFEYCDRWGNPLVYIHSRDYGKQFKVQAGEGIILVGSKRDSETGGYFKPMEYQLWSLGVDEVNDEYGGGDDICHWQR